MMTNNLRSVFISHGGGPMPLLGDSGHAEMVACLKNIAKTLPKPDVIIVVSAHWEEDIATITAAAAPSLIYDYYGFPAESYELQYPAKGDPTLANEMYDALQTAGIETRLDNQRGFDHGLFVPLTIMYPNADIPCVQLSLLHSLDPQQHIAIGKALRAISRKNVLLIGSGFSFHNMREFFSANTDDKQQQNAAFEAWLKNTCSNTTLSEQQREAELVNWESAPAARYCQPREEHLLPLHVCYGAAQSACSEAFSISVLNKQASMYIW
jgi:aromatic ring-opening dioxygenase catalytic subunit (LigB family)